MKEDIEDQIAITCFCYDAATYFDPFGHLGLKSSNLQKQEKISVNGTLLCSSSFHVVQKPRQLHLQSYFFFNQQPYTLWKILPFIQFTIMDIEEATKQTTVKLKTKNNKYTFLTTKKV